MKKLFVTLLFAGFISFIPSSLHPFITFTLSAQIPSDGLVAWYPFNGNANDESGNGNDLLNNGGAFAFDRNGNANSAIFLSSIGQSLNLAGISPDLNNNEQSFSYWFKIPQQYHYSTLTLISNGLAYSNGSHLFIDQNDAAYGSNIYLIGILMGNGTSANFFTNQQEIENWINLVSVYDGSSLSIYLNGILKSSVNYNQGVNSMNENFIFSNWGNPSQPENPERFIDDIAIYNRALSSSEIQQLYQDQTGQVQQPLTCNITTPTTTLCEGESVTLSVNTTGGTGASSQLPANLQQGLVAYYPFNGNANDESGNGNNGVVNGAILTADRFGNAGSAYSFDGVDDFISAQTSSSLLLQDNRTYGCWFKAQANSNIADHGIFGIASANGHNGYYIYLQSTGRVFSLEDNYQGFGPGAASGGLESGWTGAASNDSLYSNDGNWNFILSTKMNGITRVYINGFLQDQTTERIPNFLDANLYFGWTNLWDQFFSGEIDDAFIYNRVLSETEIQQLFNAQSYAWSTNETTPTITVTPSQNTTYSCTVTQGNQTCTASVDITVNPNVTNAISATIIEGETYTLGTQTLTTAGTYTEVFTSAAGCDSTVTLTLNVEPLLTCEITAPTTSLCEGESVTLSVNTTGGVSASSQLPANLQQGLVAYYPFNGNANDESGNGNNGLVNGATLTSDRFGNVGSAYGFDGGNSNSIGIDLNLTNTNFSFSFWMNTEDSSSSHIFDWRDTNNGVAIFDCVFDASSGGFVTRLRDSINSQTVNAVSQILPSRNQWYFVSVVFESSQIEFFINGQIVSIANYIQGDFLLNYLYIGGNYYESNWSFTGRLDEIYFHNRALSPSEIQQLYTAQSYAWSTNETTPTITITPSQNTTYSCTVTQGNQTCTASVDITVTPVVTNAISATIIEGETYTLGTQTLTTAGTYTEVFNSAAGCDSTVTLTLAVEPLLTCEITAPTTTLCEGESVTLSVNTTGGASPSSQLPANLQQGIIVYYPFESNTNDASGNNLNFNEIGNIDFVEDRFGNSQHACMLNGLNGYLIYYGMDSLPLDSSQRTVAFWMKASLPLNSVNSDIFTYGNASNSERFGMSYVYGYPYFVGESNDIWLGPPGMPSGFNNYIGDDEWHFISFSYNGNSVAVYFDGVLQALVNKSLNTQGSNLIVGRSPLNHLMPVGYHGIIDDLIIFNRVLSQSEIQQLYSAQSYFWSTNETTPTITVTPTQNTIHTCTVSQGNQTCTASVDITVNPLLTWYADNDGDGFGDGGNALEACDQPQGFVSNTNDCNDAEALAYTGAVDLCDNGIDEDCSGADSTCIVLGCTDITACNFNPAANTDDASCTYPVQTYLICDGSCINDTDGDGVCDEVEIAGCADATAFNYNPQATDDDGSCEAVLICNVIAPVTDICVGESLSISINSNEAEMGSSSVQSLSPINEGLTASYYFNDGNLSNAAAVGSINIGENRFGQPNGSYLFANNGYINLGNGGLDSNPSSYSMSLWFKSNQLSLGLYDNTSVLITRRHMDWGPTWTTLQIINSGNLALVVDGPAYSNILNSNVNVLDNAWHCPLCVAMLRYLRNLGALGVFVLFNNAMDARFSQRTQVTVISAIVIPLKSGNSNLSFHHSTDIDKQKLF